MENKSISKVLVKVLSLCCGKREKFSNSDAFILPIKKPFCALAKGFNH